MCNSKKELGGNHIASNIMAWTTIFLPMSPRASHIHMGWGVRIHLSIEGASKDWGSYIKVTIEITYSCYGDVTSSPIREQ